MSGWCHKCGHQMCICNDEWRGAGDAGWRVEMLAKDEQIRVLTERLAAAEAALARIALSQTGDECESDFAQDFLGWKSTSELWDIIKAAKAGGVWWNRLHKRMVAEMDAREAIEEVSVKSVRLSEIEQRALQVLAYPQTCTELADRLWDQRTRIANRQSWARPAGAIIARLSQAGLVHRVFPPGWELRPAQYQTVNSLRERTDQ